MGVVSATRERLSAVPLSCAGPPRRRGAERVFRDLPSCGNPATEGADTVEGGRRGGDARLVGAAAQSARLRAIEVQRERTFRRPLPRGGRAQQMQPAITGAVQAAQDCCLEHHIHEHTTGTHQLFPATLLHADLHRWSRSVERQTSKFTGSRPTAGSPGGSTNKTGHTS